MFIDARRLGLAAGLACLAHGAAGADADGPSFASHLAFRANTFTHSSQEQPVLCVARDASGNENIVAAWSSRRQNQGRYGVYAQRFTGSGVAIGSETALSLWGESHQSAPALAARADGGFTAVWQSFGQDGHAGSIIARTFRLDESGALVGGSEQLVNERWRGDQSAPVIAMGASGVGLVAWVSGDSASEPSRVACRVIGRDGRARGPEISLSEEGRAALWPTVAAVRGRDGTERFAVSFAASSPDGAPDGLRLAFVGPDGTLAEPAFRVEAAARESFEPSLARVGDGLGLCFVRPGESGDHAVFACRLDAEGRTGSSAVEVNPGAGAQNGGAIVSLDDGRFAVLYNQSGETGSRIAVQVFGANGAPLGSTFDAGAPGTQALGASGAARAARTGDGTMVVSWAGAADDADTSAAAVSILSDRPFTPAGQVGVTAAMKPAPAGFSPGHDASGAAAEPHRPPTFNPLEIDTAEREVEFRGGGSIGFTGIVNTGWTPPDPHMGVGPDHVVLMTNGAIAWHRKSDGVSEFQQDINGAGGFWGAQGAQNFMFDPEVVYDDTVGRFFAMCAEGNRSDGKSFFYLAVSDDSDPNGTWYKYRYDTTALAGNLFDSPNIGVTSDAIIVTGDGFGLGANYPVYTIAKANVLAGLPSSIAQSTTMTTSTQSAGFPPVSYDSPPAVYFIEHKEAGTNTQVRLLALQNALTAPAFTSFTLTVPSYGPPEDPPQSGTSTRPNTFDARFWNVAYRDGSLWATHHINASLVQARWYEIAMNGWPTSGNNPTLVQSGTIDPGATVRTFFTAITVTPNNHAALVFARSSPTEFISMATTHRRSCDPAGFMEPVTIRRASNAAYNSGRWGDYAAVQADPLDPRTFWAYHEWSQNGSWRTWVQSFTVPACPGECLADFNGDGFVTGEDFDEFVDAFSAGDLAADIDENSFVNGDDFDTFVLHFDAGC